MWSEDMNLIGVGHDMDSGEVILNAAMKFKVPLTRWATISLPVLYTIRNARHTKSQVPDASMLASFSWYTTEP